MGTRYVENLPDEMARNILGDKYLPDMTYQLITEREGSYVTAYDPETNTRVDLDVHTDGDPDDVSLDIEDFSFNEIEMAEDNDYTVRSFGYWPIVIGLSLVSCISITGYVCYILLFRGG